MICPLAPAALRLMVMLVASAIACRAQYTAGGSVEVSMNLAEANLPTRVLHAEVRPPEFADVGDLQSSRCGWEDMISYLGFQK